MKRDVENPPKLYPIYPVLVLPAGRLWLIVDKILLMIHTCTKCGQNVEDDISIRVASYRKLNLWQGREILGLRLAVGGEERPLLR